MNSSVCRVMVAVAGMAGLGMTAPLAGAQTHPATYSLNDVMQAPFAMDMVAAPAGVTVVTVASSAEGVAQPLLMDRGTVDSPKWGPAGKRLAFVSHRGGHSLIGVHEFIDQTIVRLSLDDQDEHLAQSVV